MNLLFYNDETQKKKKKEGYSLDYHRENDNMINIQYGQVTHVKLEHFLRVFLNCKLNIYYPSHRMLQNYPMVHRHMSLPMMNVTGLHEPRK